MAPNTADFVEYRKFSLTDVVDANHNKFWNVGVTPNGDVVSHWGRQGDPGKTTTWSGAGRGFMEKKINEKLKKGYVENKTIDARQDPNRVPQSRVASPQLADIARKQIRTKNPEVASLIDYLVRVNAHNIGVATGGKITYNQVSGAFETTQGIIVASEVDRAAALLSDFADIVSAGGSWSREDGLKLNEYLSLIPRDFGRKRQTPESVLPDLSAVRKEQDILDGLRASFAQAIAPPTTKAAAKKTDTTPQIFSVELNVIDDRKEIDRIRQYYERTKKAMHQSYRYVLKKVYQVHITTVRGAFEKHGRKVGNIRELFHGTKCSNCLSILKQGLIIPPATSSHCTGRLYGNGVYASDISSKALNYATNFWTGGGNTSRIFMFLVDFAMGRIYYPDGKYGVSYPVSGYDSTFAKAGVSGVYNNEMIVYDTKQVDLKYLLEFE
jgi:poly [ADP-ribose] polymerase